MLCDMLFLVEAVIKVYCKYKDIWVVSAELVMRKRGELESCAICLES